MYTFSNFLFLNNFYSLILEQEEERERETEREKERNNRYVVPLLYSFIGWFLYVPWPGIEPTTLVYLDNTLPGQGLQLHF